MLYQSQLSIAKYYGLLLEYKASFLAILKQTDTRVASTNFKVSKLFQTRTRVFRTSHLYLMADKQLILKS